MTNWREYGEEERACQSECRHCLMGGWIADMSKEGRRLPPVGLAQANPRNLFKTHLKGLRQNAKARGGMAGLCEREYN